MNGEKLKNKIKKRAKEIGAQPQELMQMYFLKDYYIEYQLANTNSILF